MSDRIAVMNKGLVHQVGTPTEIYEQPGNKFVADFIGETNFVEGVVLSQTGNVVEVNIEGTGKLLAQCVGDYSPGQKVSLAIRPEKMSLNRDTTNGNRITAEVEEVVYIGTDTHYGLRLPGGQRLRVREQNIDPISHLIARVGDDVTVVFPVEAARPLVD